MKLNAALLASAGLVASSLFSTHAGAAVIAFNGFESSPSDNWSFSTSGSANAGGSVGVSTATGSSDTPANQRIYAGTHSLQVSNPSSTNGGFNTTFASTSTVGYGTVSATFKLSSTSVTSGNGADATDHVLVYVALNGGAFPATPDITVNGAASGFSNTRYGYGASFSITTTAGTPNSINAGSSGPSTVTVNVPDGTTAVSMKIVELNNDANEYWNIDNVSLNGTLLNANPTISSIVGANVVFGPVVSDGATFTATVNAADTNAADVLSLVAGTLPAGISNVVVTAVGSNPAVFTITGTADYSLNGTTVNVPFTVSDGAGGSVSSAFSVNVTPEPTTLAAFGGVGAMLLRRRRA